MRADINIIPLISTRVCLYRPDDRQSIIVRQSRDGVRYVLPGGKLNIYCFETLEAGAIREVEQETTFQVSDLELIALIPQARAVHIDAKEASELGLPDPHIPEEGLTGVVTLEALFAAPVEEEVPFHPVEGRLVHEIRIARDGLSMFKEKHQRSVELYLSYIKTGKLPLKRRERRLFSDVSKLSHLRLLGSG